MAGNAKSKVENVRKNNRSLSKSDEKGTPLDEIIERVNKNHESVGEIIDIQPSESESNDS
jgi:hypothetical protein